MTEGCGVCVGGSSTVGVNVGVRIMRTVGDPIGLWTNGFIEAAGEITLPANSVAEQACIRVNSRINNTMLSGRSSVRRRV